MQIPHPINAPRMKKNTINWPRPWSLKPMGPGTKMPAQSPSTTPQLIMYRIIVMPDRSCNYTSRRAYPAAVHLAFTEREVDFAQIVKVYATKSDDHRYSPGEVVDTVKTPCCGDPDPAKICTSHVERHNLSMRMQNRRLTRLTNAFSKKWANHQAALGLYFAVYNYCRPHGTLTKAAFGAKTTPAMQAGLADHPWTLLELLQAISTH
jgi:hypothetical protein